MTNINRNKKEIRCQSIRDNTSLYKSILDNSALFNKISQISNLSENNTPTQPISQNTLTDKFVSNVFGENKKEDQNSIKQFYEKILDSFGVPMDQKFGFINNNLKYSEDSDGVVKGSITIPFGIINRSDSSRKEITIEDARFIKEKLSNSFGFSSELKTDKSGYQIVFQTKAEVKNNDHESGYIAIDDVNQNKKVASLNVILEDSLERIRRNK